MESQEILVVGHGARALQRVIPLLARSSFVVRQAATGEEAVAWLRRTTCELLVVRHPMVGMSLSRLVDAIREPHAPSFSAALLVLAEPDAEREVGPLLARGNTRVLSADAPAERVLATLAELLAAVPRAAVRVEVSVSLCCLGDDGPIAGETVNVSRKGILVRAATVPPLGSAMRFEIELPGHTRRCCGVGEVVRHGRTERDGSGEFALRIVELDPVNQKLLEELQDQA